MADLNGGGGGGTLQAGAGGLMADGQSIYQEPSAYPRLVLQRGRPFGGHSSCGRLCDYDEVSQPAGQPQGAEQQLLLGTTVRPQQQQTARRQLPDKHKFGSTPMFNSFPYNSVVPPAVPPQQQMTPQQQQVPASISCHEALRHNAYATPNLRQVPNSQSCFYAATDIFKVCKL